MKLKYAIFAMTLSVCVLANIGVSAKTTVWGNIDEAGKVRVSVTSDKGRAVYAAYLLKPGAEVDSLPGQSHSADFVGLETVVIPADAETGFLSRDMTYTLGAEGTRGTYTVVLGGGELEGYILKLTYPDADVATAAATAVKTASDASALESVLNQYQEQAWSLDLKNDVYQSHRSVVLGNMVKILSSTAVTPAAVTQAFDRACILALLKNCDRNEIQDNLLLYEDMMGLDYADVVAENPDDTTAVFANLRRDEDLYTPADLERLVTASKAVRLLNQAGRDNVLTVLKDYNAVFNLDFGGDFVKVDPYEVAKRMGAGTKVYTSLNQVRSGFADAVAQALAAQDKNSNENSNGSRPSGGGFGGSGSIGKVTGPSPSQDELLTADKLAEIETDSAFLDLDTAQWAVPYIKYLAENNIMQGDGDGRFRPGSSILREEFLKLVIEAMHLTGNLNAADNFSDVETDAWYHPYVSVGVDLGIVTGISENWFGIGQEISRQDAAVMISRAFDVAGAQLYAISEPLSFVDEANIADYAKAAVSRLTEAGIINGYEDKSFLPENPILRSEAAKIIYTSIRGIIQ